MSKLNELVAVENENEDYDDMCSCSDCGWSGKIADCYLHEECESWELPQLYTVIDCPKCEDGGCIENFWSSKEIE
jgi:hypothetical protein